MAARPSSLPVEYSTERGSLFDDEDFAFEAQLVARPDGTRVYGTFNTEGSTTGSSAAAFRSADIVEVDDGTTPGTTDEGGGCTAATSQRPVDPMLPLFAALGLIGWGLRRTRRS